MNILSGLQIGKVKINTHLFSYEGYELETITPTESF